jgi:chromosome segregation ATPase
MLGSVSGDDRPDQAPGLGAVADELYALAPGDFTGTRNARAAELRGMDRELAARVKRLPKPATAAWVVNMLVRHRAELLDQIVQLGGSLREAQQNMAGDELRELNRQRRRLTTAVATQARALGGELGVRVSDAVAAQVEETLRAAMVDAGAAAAVRTGQLIEPLAATGLDEIAEEKVSAAVAVPELIGMAARPVRRSRPQLSVVKSTGKAGEDGEASGSAGPEDAGGAASGPPGDGASARERRREQPAARVAEAEQELAEAEATLDRADRKQAKARKKSGKLEARSLQLQAEIDELRRRIGDLEHELDVVDEELSTAQHKHQRAADRQERARAARDEARQRLAGLCAEARESDGPGSETTGQGG